MTAMDLQPADNVEKEEGSEWIDTSEPAVLSIASGLPVHKEVGPVVSEDYIALKAMQFTARRKAFSFGEADWTFTDSDGYPVFEVIGGKFGYVNIKRFLCDAGGNAVVQMQKKPWNLKSKWVVQSASNEKPLWTMNKTGVLKLFKPSIDVFLASNTERKTADYHIQGNLFGQKGSINHGTHLVAEVEHIATFDTEDEEDTFTVTVFDGVDYAFILSLLVVTDMVYISGNIKKKHDSPAAGPTQIYP